MASLGTNRLNIVNDQPAVEKLWNGRYRLEFYCDNDGKKTDWYYTNVGNILPDFGTLQGDGFGEAPSESIAESKYADMRLVEVGTEYVPAANQHYVKLTYETLTAAWVLEKDEDTDYELNGLKRVTRQSVALPDTPYANVVGTSTITSDGTTLYLGSYKIEETDAKWMLTEVWLEAGQLSETISEPDRDGKITTTVEWFGTPPVGLSDVIASRTSEYEGLPTYQFSYVNTSTLTTGYSYVTTVPFSIPGTVTTETNGVTGIGSFTNLQLVISPPVATNVEATITVEFTTSPVVNPLVYRPASWTRTKIYGAGRFGRAFASTTTHANHIRIGSGDTISTSVTGSSVGFIQGNRVYAGTTAVCEITGPTYDPAGKIIILSDTNEPAFILADGTQYFRRTTVVASIPSRDT